MTSVLVAVGLGYLSGSLPWGLWLGLRVRGIDVRTVGSHNLGATNVYRSLGPGLGIATLVLDLAKGALPVLLVPGGSALAAFLLVFAVTVAISRFISLGSILGAVGFATTLGWVAPHGVASPTFAFGVLLALLVIVRHRDNIVRLARGEERRFSFKRDAV